MEGDGELAGISDPCRIALILTKHAGFLTLLRGETASNEDSPQRIFLPVDGHGRADFQVAEGIETGDDLEQRLPGGIAKVWTLEKKKPSQGLRNYELFLLFPSW